MPSLYGGSAPAQMVRTPGTAGPVQNLLAFPGAIYGADLTTALPSLVLMDAGAGGAYISRALTPISAELAATEAKDVAAFSVTFTATGVTANLAATEAKDIAAFDATIGAGNVTAELAATENQDTAQILVTLPLPIVDIDTHDGDRQRRRFAVDRDERKRRRRDIIEAFEVLVEGKDPIVEEIVEEFTVAQAKPSLEKPRIDYDKLFRNLDAVERLWNAYIDMDDEEILLLL